MNPKYKLNTNFLKRKILNFRNASRKKFGTKINLVLSHLALHCDWSMRNTAVISPPPSYMYMMTMYAILKHQTPYDPANHYTRFTVGLEILHTKKQLRFIVLMSTANIY